MKKRKENEMKRQQVLAKKRFIATGCGHDNVQNYFVPASILSTPKTSHFTEAVAAVPVTMTKDVEDYGSNSGFQDSQITTDVDVGVEPPDDISPAVANEEETNNEFAGTVINFEFPDGFVCQGCGNKKAMCHQFLWGGNLLQEAVSKFDKRKHTFEIDSEDVKEDMKQKYN